MSRNDVLVTADWAEENLGTPGQQRVVVACYAPLVA